jgi:hypothetical protein
MMETVWHILLTVCSGSTCLEQDVQWFKTQSECETMMVEYVDIPVDGDWDTVEFICKPVGSISS